MIKKRIINDIPQAQVHIKKQILLQWISLLAQIVMIISIANIFEDVVFNQLNSKGLLIAIIIIVIGVSIRFVCEKQVVKEAYLASYYVKSTLREKIYNKLLSLGNAYQSSVATSKVVQMASEGVEQLEIYFSRYLSQFFYSLLAPLTLFIVLSFINFKASLVLLVFVPLIPLSIVMIQKLAKRLLNKYWGIYLNLGDSFLENLEGLTTLKIYQADADKAEKMDEEAQHFRKITMKVLTMQLNSTSVMDIMAYGGAAVGMLVVINEYQIGNVGLAGAVAIILLAAEFFLPLRLLGSYFHIAMNGMAASDNIYELLDLPEDKNSSLDLDTDLNNIQFSNVNFAYNSERQILKGINLEIPSQGLVGLVGMSGCGKSTIAKLLNKQNINYQGMIKYNDLELKDISYQSLNKQVTMITHQSYLFKGSVRSNLLMAKANATDSEMISVLEKVCLWDFFNANQGLDTPLLAGATNLSGGQAQRLGIARALLHDSPMYIFDEATSNIDVESEEIIMDVVYELAKTKMIVVISHRLANVVNANNIYMMQQGEIVESGKHQELLVNNGAYAQLFNEQAKLEAYRKVV